MQNLHFCFASIHRSLPSLTALHPILFSIIEKKIKCFGTVEVVLHGLALLFFLPWCNSLFPSLTHLHSFKSHILCSTQGMVLHGVYLLHSSLNALIWSHFCSSLTLSEMLPWSTYFNNYLLHFLTHLSWFFFMRAVCFASLFTKSLGGLWLYLCSPLPPQHQEQLKAWRDAHQRSMNGWFMVSYMSASWRPVLLCLWMHLTQHWASSFQQRTWHAAPNEWRGVFKCWCLHIVTDIGKHGKPGFSQESV